MNNIFFLWWFFAAVSLPAWLPGEGMGDVIDCHPPLIREEGLSRMSCACYGLISAQTFWAWQKQHSLNFFCWEWCLMLWIQAVLKPPPPPRSAISSDAYINRVSFIPVPVSLLQIPALMTGSCRSALWFWRASAFCSGQYTNDRGPRHSSN